MRITLDDTRGTQLLLCPVCGDFHLHHVGVIEEFDEYLRPKRAGIRFFCENCGNPIHHQDGRYYTLWITQYKGETSLEWELR